MFQQQNQCQHRLNCVLPRADNCQAIAEITNACNFTASNNTRKQFDGSKQLPFENISGKSWRIFFFAWRVCVGGRIQSYETPEPQTPVASATARISALQEEPTKLLWRSAEMRCWASPLPLAPRVVCTRGCPKPRQQRLPVLSVLCSSGWLYEQGPQDEGASRPRFSGRNPDRYKPNGI